jgi:hypothetical protein
MIEYIMQQKTNALKYDGKNIIPNRNIAIAKEKYSITTKFKKLK